MAAKIRLLRMGRKKKPFYRIIVVDSRRSTQSGSYLQQVGEYDPLAEKKVINADLVKEWLAKGAQPSERVKKLLQEVI